MFTDVFILFAFVVLQGANWKQLNEESENILLLFIY